MDIGEFTRIILSIVLSSARLMGFMMVLSPMTDSMLPGVARRAVVVSFGLVMAPVVFRELSTEQYTGFALCFLGLKEVVIGFLLGFFANVPFYMSECVGNIIDNQRGSTMSEVYSPLSGTQVSTTGIFLTQLTTVLFFVSGLFLIALGAVYKSYEYWPLLTRGLSFHSGTSGVVLGVGDSLLRDALIVSSPILIVMFLATVGLGLVNRTAPQLNVFFLSMPIKSALGIFMLIIYIHYMLDLLLYQDEGPIVTPVRKILESL